jgi:hypothetical protein
MHFLNIIIQTPQLEDPAKNHFNVHRHFYRYSKGEFLGPALKITRTKAKITLKGSHEYEDLIQEITCKTASEDSFEIKGVLLSGKDISEILTNLGLDWKLKKSTGKTKNYKAEFLDDTISKENLIETIETLRESSYLLLNFNNGPSCKVTTKKRIPQPSKKKAEEDDLSKRIQFCSGVTTNTDSNIDMIFDMILPDFKSKINENWKKLSITNNYKITGIEIPKNIKNSMLMRVMAIRTGKMIRSLDVNGEELIENQYNIVV